MALPAARAHPHVLMLDEGFASGALTALGLRDAGCRVSVRACVGGTAHARSRNLDWRLMPSLTDDRFADLIDEVVTELEPDVVYLLTEPLQEAFRTRSSSSWSDRLHPRSNDSALFRDKGAMSDWISSHGILCPVRSCVSDAGAHSVVVRGARGRGGQLTTIATSVATAQAAVDRLHALGVDAVIHEYINGPTFLVGGLFHGGVPLRLYAGEKRSQFPARVGPAARIRSVDDSALISAALRVFEALRWTGIASTDFVRDGDGRFHFLEVNPRPWGSIGAAAASGVDLFTPLRALLLGERVPADLRFQPGVEFTVFPLSLVAPAEWRSKGFVGGSVRDISRVLGRTFRQPGESLHILHRSIRGLAQLRAAAER